MIVKYFPGLSGLKEYYESLGVAFILQVGDYYFIRNPLNSSEDIYQELNGVFYFKGSNFYNFL
jgi:hypothetical protein